MKNPREYPPLSKEVAETLFKQYDENRVANLDEITKMIFQESYRLGLIERCPHNNWRRSARGKLVYTLLHSIEMIGCMDLTDLED